ncbi:diguanylate cyclase (GGDEF)-like protein [Vibrio sp. ES.051]|uniref:GGDEF domain-containing protein n=1 Tax=Vibrio sp. ES.051 TaxID=1761909 RepID=UPI000BF6CEEC|nr:GGDEF domain-containing protein [Vibrio sp. ES.051]PFG45444.1 diguanylate cyclase (GGDEF)-like protein [Vibrio sp. ES.051]
MKNNTLFIHIEGQVTLPAPGCNIIPCQKSILLNKIYELEAEKSVLIQNIANLNTRLNHDYLTGLKSREAAIETIANWLKNQEISTIGIVYMDIDNLKKVNDLAGHAAGDQALNYMGKTLKQCRQPECCVARLSGDEFIAILPNTSEEALERWSLNVEKNLRLHGPININDHKISVSVSMGRYFYDKSYSVQCMSPKQLIEKADLSMYKSKNNKINHL